MNRKPSDIACGPEYSQSTLRCGYVAYNKIRKAIERRMQAAGADPVEIARAMPPLPREFIGLQCGVKTRKGTPCKIEQIFSNGRCKWHGGLCTGPKTRKGKAQSRISGRLGGRPKKPK